MANGKEIFINVHNETPVGEKDGENYTKCITEEDTLKFDLISRDRINELKEQSNKGAYDYNIEEYPLVDGKTLISVITTEDMGFSHGYESGEHTYLLEEEKK